MKHQIVKIGRDKLAIDCGDYHVHLKSTGIEYASCSITYIDLKGDEDFHITEPCLVNWDMINEDVTKIKIYFKSRFGSIKIFEHQEPDDAKEMFDFIGNGFDLFKK